MVPIDKQAAIDALMVRDKELRNINWYDKPFAEGECKGIDYALEIVNALPSAQPERKTGKWIDEGFYADGHGAHAFRCSECGGHIIEYDADPFCKWCGADMRGEDDDIPIEYFENGGI